MTAIVEPIAGRYVRLDIDGAQQRVYVEEAGEGVPLLCLHTAGSDTRQFRDLLNDQSVTDRFRVVTFDLPWHGKSSPPKGWQRRSYRLTAAAYLETVLTMIEALALDRPVVVGCSIGGKLCGPTPHQNIMKDHGNRAAAAAARGRPQGTLPRLPCGVYISRYYYLHVGVLRLH